MILGQLIAQLQNKQNNFEKRLAQLESAANAARAEHMDRTRADREIDQFTSASAGVPNRQGIDVPVNTAQSQPTADVGAECPKSSYGDGRHTWHEDGSVCRDCGQARQNTGPAVDSQFLATPSNEGAGASAAGSVPLDEAISELNAAHSRLNIHQWNAYQAILSHIAAQQAEIERLQKRAEEPEHDWLLLLQQSTMRLQEIHTLRADRDRLARELKDHKAVHADQRRLVRELDVLLNGEEGAAAQASLCDIVSQVRHLQGKSSAPMLIELEEAHSLARELEQARKWQEWGEKYLGVIRNSLYASCRVAAAMGNNNSGISEALAAMPKEQP